MNSCALVKQCGEFVDGAGEFFSDPDCVQSREHRRQLVFQPFAEQGCGLADLIRPAGLHVLDRNLFTLFDGKSELAFHHFREQFAGTQGCLGIGGQR